MDFAVDCPIGGLLRRFIRCLGGNEKQPDKRDVGGGQVLGSRTDQETKCCAATSGAVIEFGRNLPGLEQQLGVAAGGDHGAESLVGRVYGVACALTVSCRRVVTTNLVY